MKIWFKGKLWDTDTDKHKSYIEDYSNFYSMNYNYFILDPNQNIIVENFDYQPIKQVDCNYVKY